MLNINEHGEVCEIQLHRPPVNALNIELIEKLGAAIEEAGKHAGAVVLSGQAGMFSAGLDVPALLALDRPDTERFVRSFFKLMETVARLPIPVACAITGHCPAGGTVLVIFADYRIMCRGKYRMGLNEVKVGLTVPEVIQNAMVRLTGKRMGERLMVAGKLVLPDEALQVGLVDTLVDDSQQAVSEAIGWCNDLLALPREAMLTTRQIARADLGALFDDFGEDDISRFVAGWFDPATQTGLHNLVKKIRK
ncbi:MAG: enoyl-CoA hydratase/isomerase family protein [Rhodothermales bacterium]